jgi:hypothetical protein
LLERSAIFMIGDVARAICGRDREIYHIYRSYIYTITMKKIVVVVKKSVTYIPYFTIYENLKQHG